MQVDFDTAYLLEDNEAQRKIKSRQKAINTHQNSILDVVMEDAGDYEALTTLYRKIFKFLVEFAPNTRTVDKVIEREVAAALESVFPRVGLKTFIQLSDEDKRAQLMELARIVLGIRLYNREEGRGGAGIQEMDKDSVLLANVLLQDIDREIEFFDDACTKYQQAIIRAHVYGRKKKFLEKQGEKTRKQLASAQSVAEHLDLTPTDGNHGGLESSHLHGIKTGELFLISQMEDVNEDVITRWSQELANRRQYLGFLRTLQDEARYIHEKITTLSEKLRLELITVKSLIHNKSSVPKEIVYPRFDALGAVWLQLYEEVVVMIARSNTFQVLCKYRLSFSPTLSDEIIAEGEVGGKQWTLEPALAEAKTPLITNRSKSAGGVEVSTASDSKETDAKVLKDLIDAKGEDEMSELQSQQQALQLDVVEDNTDYTSSGAQLLSVEDTPDFMLLPLEFQGFCPWTVVEAKGLLIPGKPSLGIVRFENQYYVFDHVAGQKAFMKNPEKYLRAIRERALRCPEYIHLLRLHKWFPTASIARLLQKQEMDINNQTGQPFTKDAATETPTHFIESYIDLNYHWNEWELRRRALKIVNLKNCKTTAQQTDLSHFRRDNETQVFVSKTSGTQTKRDKGTNPPIVTTYVQGLRGQVIAEEKESKDTSDEKGEKEFKARKIAYPKVGVVKLTLDL
eukprot:scaffold667_cov168-Ochromonas_danica.AAC.11